MLQSFERAATTQCRRSITVTGVVQGVGFRPFVHRLASRLSLCGFVKNWTGGALIEVEGELAAIDRFSAELQTCQPSLIEIDGLRVAAQRPRGEAQFRIEASEDFGAGVVVVAPDIATCDDCLRELFDSEDRRYRHPFISCAHCGPRLTIMVDAPYDRARTTMARFAMCDACHAEYEDPQDRRFHAQPIACPACGPRLQLLEPGATSECRDALARSVDALCAGKIVAVKGIGGYHLVCDATDDTVVRELRRRKMRDDKPFAVMVADVAGADALCEVSAVERRALTSPTRPVVLLRRRVDSAVADAVAPRHTLLGVMLPYTPLQHLLLHDMPDRTLVMTSGNRSDEPIVHHDGDLKRLSGIPDFVLTHDRPIHLRCDDSVVRVVADAVLPVRRARGEAPRRFRLRTPLACPTLALGGHLKAAVALGQDSHVVPSHHLGDLDDYQAYRAYVEAIEHYQRLFRIVPHRLVHDLHPDYASSRYALERAGATAIGIMAVQHHHAHMASCMAEHGLAGPVIGVCFDGTGWGTDGAIWGGEFLLGDDRDVQRAGHLDYVAMPGGETAIREPWRMALAHLIHAGEPIGRTSIARRIDADRIGTVEKMFERNFNAPLTSSVGRLFDAVAALVGVCDRVTYEGQAAMALESLASQVSPDGAYPFALLAPGNRIVVDPRPLIRAIMADARDGIVPAIIARRFHSTLVDIVATVCDRVRAVSGVTAVVLSGGVFVNGILACEVSDQLAQRGFSVYRHQGVPPNDGGLCLGQLAIAAARDAVAGSEAG